MRACVRVCVLLGPDVFLISADERAKHDQQFHSLSPNAGGYITGSGSCLKSQCVHIFINSPTRLK